MKCRHGASIFRYCRQCDLSRYAGLATAIVPVEDPAMNAPQGETWPTSRRVMDGDQFDVPLIGVTVKGALTALLAIERADAAGLHDPEQHAALAPVVLGLRAAMDQAVASRG